MNEPTEQPTNGEVPSVSSSQVIDLERSGKRIGLAATMLGVAVVLVGALGFFVNAKAGDLVRVEIANGFDKHEERPHVGAATKEDIEHLREDFETQSAKSSAQLERIITAVESKE